MAVSSPNNDGLEHCYDEVPYPGHAHPQSDPLHLYTLATLFGLKPSRVENASILELGCSEGENLIPMAFHFPKAQCTGIDISGKEIARGNKKIHELKLKNITLKHQSIFDFNSKDKFDYIICHGVYSWVTDEIRNKILQICHDNLQENGIAYVSYNIYPGWNMVKNVRDLMLWHTKNTKKPLIKTTQSRAILKYYSEGLKDTKTSYAEILKNENELLENRDDAYLFHEHLSLYNEPVYFYQFIEQVTKHNLSYLCNSILENEHVNILAAPFAEDLKKVEDVVERCQKIDFIYNQRFRWSLLCHNTQKINRNIVVNDVEQYDIQLKAELDKSDLTEKDIGQLSYIVISTPLCHMKISNPIVQMAILILHNNRHKSMPYHDLCNMVHEKTRFSNLEEIKNILRNDLYLTDGMFSGLFAIRAYSRDYIVKVTEKPIACPLARYLALQGNTVTNRRHETIYLDVVSKCLLPFLNGSNDISSLREIARSRLSFEALNLLDEEKHPIQDQTKIDKCLTQLCSNILEKIAIQAILIG